MRFTAFLLFLFTFFAFTLTAYAADAVLERGIAQFRAENYEEALDFFIKAREQDPKSTVAAFYLGLVYKQMGDFPNAAKNLKDAVTLTPPVEDAYVELIDILYNMNDLAQAKEWIAKAEERKIKPGTIAFLKGMVLAKEDRNKEAVEAFKSAKTQDKSLEQASDFQIAMAYAKDKKLKEARDSLKAVISVAPNSELAAFAKDYDTAISKLLASYRTWHLTLGMGYQFDTNVISKPSAYLGPDIENLLSKGKTDSSIFNSFRLDYTPMMSGPVSLTGQLNFYTNNYFHNPADKNNTSVVGLSLTPGYNFASSALTLPLSYNHIWLHDQEYMGLFSVKPTYTAMLAPGHLGQLSIGFNNRDMLQPSTDPDEDRTGQVYSIGAGYIYPFSEGKGMFNLKYELSLDNAKGSNWDNRGVRIGATLLTPVYKKVSFLASFDAFLQNYRHIHTVTVANANLVAAGNQPAPGYPDVPTKRQDRTYTGTAGIIWEALKGLNVNLTFTHTTADSNFAIYDYKRDVYSAGVEYSF